MVLTRKGSAKTPNSFSTQTQCEHINHFNAKNYSSEIKKMGNKNYALSVFGHVNLVNKLTTYIPVHKSEEYSPSLPSKQEILLQLSAV